MIFVFQLDDIDDFIAHQLFHPLPNYFGVVHLDGWKAYFNKICCVFLSFNHGKPTVPRLDHALEHFLDLVQKRHYEGWELVQVGTAHHGVWDGSFGREGREDPLNTAGGCFLPWETKWDGNSVAYSVLGCFLGF